MSGRSIDGTYTAGVALTNTGDNPVTILSSASIANASGVALQAAAVTYWAIGNAGRISGYDVGVSLPGDGSLVNDGHISASQTTAAPGYSYNPTTKTFTPLSGGVLMAGGGVNNTSSAVIAGYFEGVALGGGGSVVNAGSIHTGTTGFGVVLTAGGSVSNAPTGTISAGRYGVLSFGSNAATVTNHGLITSQKAVGVDLFGGGTVGNAAGTITGASYGVVTAGGAVSTVTNQAVITGQSKSGVALISGGTLSNTGSGVITGGVYGIVARGTATISNLGSVTGQTAAGVALFVGGSVGNGGSAVIQGGAYGVAATGSAATVANQGTIAGGSASGVLFVDGGYVSNAKTGTITGAYFGVEITNVSGSVNNLGSVSSSRSFTGLSTFDAAGVDLAAGGTVTNGLSGNIRATWKGVEIGTLSASVGGTVLNQGTIYASNATGNTGAAVWIHGPALISNAATGTIAGGPFGIVSYFQTTVVNYGSIGGTEFAIDAFPGFANRVIVGPGASFSGAVSGGNTIGSTIVSTLELASASLQGTLSGLGSQFTGFAQVTIDPGASWTLSGTNSLAAGVTLTDRGTLLLNGTALSGAGSATISDTAGNFADATIDGAGAVWSGPVELVVGDQGNGSLIVGNQGTVQTAGDTSVDPSQGFAIAQSAGGSGNVAVIGGKSLLSNTGRFLVGDAGFGKLSIEAGGTVITTPGTVAGLNGAEIAAQAGSDGSAVDVTGASSNWSITGSLLVGEAAFGSLAVSGGGAVAADQMDVGVLAGGSGIVSVVGKGSDLTLAGQLTVGDAASAELSILSGGSVSALNGDIGLQANGTGNVDIEGPGSHLDIANDLNIGETGVGVLTLGNGTELTVVNNLNIGANGVLNQFGGIIDPSVVNNTGRAGGKGAITATVSIVNTGTLFTASGTETLVAPVITGTGVLEIDTKGNLTINVGSVAATQTVTFTDGTGILTIGTLGGFAAAIGDFITGDDIVLPGTSVASTSFDASTHVLTLFDASSTTIGTLQFGTSVTGSNLVADGAGGIGTAPCFVAGTRISTERGEVAVEDLREGDRVQVVLRHPHPNPPPLRGRGGSVPTLPLPRSGGGLGWGQAQPVTWIGHRHVDSTRHPEPRKVWPVRITAGAFGPGRPCRDLFLSPDHAVYVEDVLIPVKYLINGATIAQVPRNEVTYYHVELPEHSVLFAEGLPAESYLDTGDRSNFANGGGPIALYPDFATRAREARGCAPLVVTGPELAAARRWVNALAAALAVDVRTGGGYIARPTALPLPSRDTGLPRWRNW